MNQDEFHGFTQQGLTFLRLVRENNSKEWFEENRAIYDEFLIKPMKALVDELGLAMQTIDDQFEIRPQIDKTISRIYRDTRFSPDKSRYKSRIWLSFKRPSPMWKEAPAYFCEISVDRYVYGVGYFSASKQTMDLFRARIEKSPTKFLSLAKPYLTQFSVAGDLYKRQINKQLSPELAFWHNRKNIALIKESHEIERLFSADFAKQVREDFLALAPFYHFMQEVEQDKREVTNLRKFIEVYPKKR